MAAAENTEFADEEDLAVDPADLPAYRNVVVTGTDWTTETIVSQLVLGNIDINPRFQRRDAWTVPQKSKFIESIIMGLPIPQVVLAEKQNQRGKFVVLDGKQRLLTLLQFTGNAPHSPTNGFALSSLDARQDLGRKRYSDLVKDPGFSEDLAALQNHTIRAVVIRNWPNVQFLHMVFLRLNTGSVKLSPQELRQAMFPGPFSDYVDDAASSSAALQRVLGRKNPDPRMRDVELLVRFLAFRRCLPDYTGRMKTFLDDTCAKLNNEWATVAGGIQSDVALFERAATDLFTVFGTERVARKHDSQIFNRAIFDALMFYAADDRLRLAMVTNSAAVAAGYQSFVQTNERFRLAVESDTAGVPNTFARIYEWGAFLQTQVGQKFPLPRLVGGRIIYP